MTKATHNLEILLHVARVSAAIHDAICHAADQAASLQPQQYERLIHALGFAKSEYDALLRRVKEEWKP